MRIGFSNHTTYISYYIMHKYTFEFFNFLYNIFFLQFNSFNTNLCFYFDKFKIKITE